MPEPLSVFVPSAGTLLTDRRGHGEGLIAWNMLSGMARRGHRLTVCAREADLDGDPPFELIVTGRSSRHESIEPLAHRRTLSRLFERLGGADRFELVHWFRPQGRQAMLWSPPEPTPMVVGPWSPAWPANGRCRRPGDLLRALGSPVFGALHERAMGRASAILISTAAARMSVGAEHRVRTSVLPFGVDTVRFRPSPLPPAPRILFVGGLKRAKGARELVAAFAEVRKALPDARLLVAGEGPDRESIEADRDRLGLGDALELLGAVPPSAMPELLRGSSLLCLPSRAEPFGMVVLEAMASGRAVISTDAGGPRYLVDDPEGGRRIPVDYEPPALAAALCQVLRDPAGMREMGLHNRRRVEREFAWNVVLDRLDRVYAAAVGED